MCLLVCLERKVTEFALQMSAEESCALSGVGLTSPPGEQGDPSACNPVSQPLVRASPLTLPNLQCQLLTKDTTACQCWNAADLSQAWCGAAGW